MTTTEHVYVVLRLDKHQLAHTDIPNAITGTKAFWSEGDAISEANRLNEENADKDATYFWRLVRLQEHPND